MKKILFFMATIAMAGMLSGCSLFNKSKAPKYDKGCYEITVTLSIFDEESVTVVHEWFDSAEECEDYYNFLSETLNAAFDGDACSIKIDMKKTGDSLAECEEYDDYENATEQY